MAKKSPANNEEKELLDNLADAIIESLKEESSDEFESYSQYRNKIHAQLLDQLKDFKTRFFKGYQILTKEK